MVEEKIQLNLDDFVDKLAKLKHILRESMVEKINSSKYRKEIGAFHVSMSYVFSCSAIEVFMKKFLSIIIEEINSSLLSKNKIYPSLFSISLNENFISLQSIRNEKMWIKRVEMLSDVLKSDTFFIKDANIWGEGRTIEPKHIELIWLIFNFRGEIFTDPRHKLALIDLAEGRNEVAHGETDPIVFGRKKNSDDVLKNLNYIEEIFTQVSLCAIDYVRNKEYKIS